MCLYTLYVCVCGERRFGFGLRLSRVSGFRIRLSFFTMTVAVERRCGWIWDVLCVKGKSRSGKGIRSERGREREMG